MDKTMELMLTSVSNTTHPSLAKSLAVAFYTYMHNERSHNHHTRAISIIKPRDQHRFKIICDGREGDLRLIDGVPEGGFALAPNRRPTPSASRRR